MELKMVLGKTHACYFNKEINKLKLWKNKKRNKYPRYCKSLVKVIRELHGIRDCKVDGFSYRVTCDLIQRYRTLNLKKMSEAKIKGLNQKIRNIRLLQFINYLGCKAYGSMSLLGKILKCSRGTFGDCGVSDAKNIFCLGQAYLLSLISSTVVLTQEVSGVSRR